jgi:ATP-dependent RNA helicase RhlE
MKFEEYRISPEIKKSLEELQFKRPTDIQFKAIPSILNGEDVLAIAQTGTGKTGAFAIPILHLLQQKKNNNIHHSEKNFSKKQGKTNIKCLVMVPTRELCIQIAEVFQKIGKYTNVNTFALYGGIEQTEQVFGLQEDIDILISTPGRMFSLESQGHISLDRVEILVLDEADLMLDLGFIRDIRDVIKLIPNKHQTLFFSATINKKIKELAYSIVWNPIRIQISPKDPVSKNVTHSVIFVEMDNKRAFLERIINENPTKKILVFARTRVRVERVFKAMERVKIPVLLMHGGKEQENRLEVIEDFRNGVVRILVTTDVSARGIDIAGVDYVVNYDMPEISENYVHRVGRTGRGDKKGFAISFCSKEEKPILEEIEDYLGNKIAITNVDKQDYSQTLALSEDVNDNWKQLLKEAAFAEKAAKEKPFKKSKKKK